MPGFIISNTKTQSGMTDDFAHSYVNRQEYIDTYKVSVHTIDQFIDDKLFNNNNQHFVVTEGIWLNKHELLNSKQNGANVIYDGYSIEGMRFFKKIIGNVSGALYDKKIKKWMVWTNHTGDAAVFWYCKDGIFVAGSQYDYVLDTLRANGILTTYNREAAYSMLTYGYMCDDRTYSSEIHRLLPGECIEFDGTQFNVTTYWELKKDRYDMSAWSKEDILKGLNEQFKKAIYLEFNKDKEYGYTHLVDISGGFDARMVNWVAKHLNYNEILNIHYSQSNSNEEKISKQMSEFLGNMLLIRPLNDISFIYDIDRIVGMNYGLSLYIGITGGESLLKSLNFNLCGIEHTGMIGDVVIGSFLDNEVELTKKELSGMYSSRLKAKMDTEHLNKYLDFELQKIYIRGLLGACSSFLIRKKYTEPMAVFLNPDLLEYCMSIPLKYRIGHNLYNEWIIKYYPSAAQFNWTNTDAKITDPRILVNIKTYIRKKVASVLRKMKLQTSSHGMNPFNYWYKTRKKYREFCQSYFDENINHSAFDEELKSDMIDMFNNGSPMEKSQVMTVLASAKLYY